jgi:hypothetical protein
MLTPLGPDWLQNRPSAVTKDNPLRGGRDGRRHFERE